MAIRALPMQFAYRLDRQVESNCACASEGSLWS